LPDPQEKISLPFPSLGKFPGGTKIVHKREKEDGQVKFIGKRSGRETEAVERSGEPEKNFFPSFLAQGAEEGRKKSEEHPRFDHQPHRFTGRAFPEFPKKFIPNPGRGAEPNLFNMGEKRSVGVLYDREAGSGRMAEDPDHPHRIMDKFFLGVADAADQPPSQIVQPSYVIHEREVGEVVENSVDGDVPAESVLGRRAEGIIGGEMILLVGRVEFGASAEGGDFDEFTARGIDPSQAETAADQTGAPEEIPDLTGRGVGGHVKVFGGLPQEEIPDAPSHQEGRKALMVEPVKNLESMGVDVLAGDGVRGPGKNSGRDGFIHEVVWQWPKAYGFFFLTISRSAGFCQGIIRSF
jgi:hypothetical protein